MKSYIFILIAGLLLTGCSNNSDSIKDSQSIDVELKVNLSALKINENDFSLFNEEINLGIIEGTQEKIAQIKIFNDETVSKEIQIAVTKENGFSLITNRCPALLEVKKSCSFYISFKSRDLFTGDYQSLVTVNSKDIVVKGSVTGKNNPLLTGTAVLSVVFKDGDNFSSNTNPIKTIEITNIGDGVASNVLPTLPSGYLIRINRCSRSLAPGASCYIQVIFKNHRTMPATAGNFQVSATSPGSITPVNSSISLQTGLPPSACARGTILVASECLSLIQVATQAEFVLPVDHDSGVGSTPLFFSQIFTGTVGASGTGVGASGSGMTPSNTAPVTSRVLTQAVPLVNVQDLHALIKATVSSSSATVEEIIDVTPTSISTVPNLADVGVKKISNPFYLTIPKHQFSTSSNVEFNLEVDYKILNESDPYSSNIKSIATGKGYKISRVSRINFPDESVNNVVGFDNAIYFSARIADGTSKIHRFNQDGTINQISNGNENGYGISVVFNNELYFVRPLSMVPSNKLFKINPAGEIKQVSNIMPGGNDGINNFKVFNNELYFSATSSLGSKLYKLSTTGTITQLSNINPGESDLIGASEVFNNHLYFIASTSGQSKLFKISTTGVITQVSNTRPGNSDAPSSLFKVFNNELYFVSTNPLGHKELYKIDQEDNIKLAADTRPNGSDTPYAMEVYNNKLYFVSTNQNSYRKLFSIDLNGVVNQESNSLGETHDFSGTVNFKEFQGDLFFTALSPEGFQTLQKINSDGIISLILGAAPTGEMVINDGKAYFNLFSALYKMEVQN